MTTFVIEITREAVQVTIMVAAPLLLTALAVGLTVSFLQAITQINEQSLVFVPKAACMAAVLILGMPWYLRTLVRFTTKMFEATAGFGG